MYYRTTAYIPAGAGSLPPYRDEIIKTVGSDGTTLSWVVSRKDSGRKVKMLCWEEQLNSMAKGAHQTQSADDVDSDASLQMDTCSKLRRISECRSYVTETPAAYSGLSHSHNVECAKRWQQSLDPDLDHSEWRDDEVLSCSFLTNEITVR